MAILNAERVSFSHLHNLTVIENRLTNPRF